MKKTRNALTALAVTAITAFAALSPYSTANAQDAVGLGSKLVGGAIGYAIGSTQKDKAEWAPAAGAALGILIGDYAAGKWENKENKKQLDYYLSGMNYQRWLAANKQWHTYTLDPHTGRPPAFAGLTEMDAGMPGAYRSGGNGSSSQNSGNGQSGYNTDASRPSAATQQVVHMPVVIPSGEYGGVARSERTLYFPRLP